MKSTSRQGPPGISPAPRGLRSRAVPESVPQQAPRQVPRADPSLEEVAEGGGLAPTFPSEETGTGLVLYGGGAGGMRIHWRLARNDFERAAASFPLSGRRPVAVVRLRRERPEGGADLADEALLGLAVRDGTGERRIQLPVDHCLYHAELGLTNGEGGWLMLIRSNGLYNAAGIGIRWEDLDPVPAVHPSGLSGSGEMATGPTGVKGGPSAAMPRTGSVAEPTLGGGDLPPGPAEFPLVPWEGSSGAGSAFGASGPQTGLGPFAEAAGLDPRGPAVSILAPSREEVAPESRPGDGLEAVLDPRVGPGDDLGPPLLGSGPEGGDPRATGTPRTGVAIEPLTYASPLQRANGVELEAELRILGRATPGRVIDLYGFRYRVGPGGRFKLTLPVTDPELLRRALAAAPPPELSQHRDD